MAEEVKVSFIEQIGGQVAKGIDMDRISIYSTLKGLRQCLGEFRDLDYMIRVYREDFHPDLHHPVDYSVLIHEWIHYLQFLSTSFGRDVSMLRRRVLLSMIDLLRNLPQPIYVPVLNWLERDPQVRNSPWVSAFSMALSILKAQWEGWVGLDASWDTRLEKISSCIPYIEPEYLTSQAPLKLDLEKPAFVLALPDRTLEVFEIGALQVLEFMARAVEVHNACVRSYWSGISSHIGIWNTRNIDYNAPFLYLIQNGILGRPGNPMAWLEAPEDLLYLPMLVVICQVALMDSWFCVRRWEYKEYQGFEGKVPIPTCSEKPSGFSGKPGNTFTKLLRLIGCPEPWEYMDLLHLAIERFKMENWVEVADRLCVMAGVAKYSEMHTLALEALREEWSMVSKGERGLGRMSSVLEAEYQTAVQAFELLQSRQDVLAYPVRLFDKLPLPLVSAPMQDGSGMGLVELWDTKRSMLPPEAAVLLCGWDHLAQKLLCGHDLACFWADSPIDTLWACHERKQCSERLRQLRLAGRAITQSTGFKTLLEQCVNPEWVAIIEHMLRELGISEVRSLGEPVT